MYIILKMILVSDKLLKKINKGINYDLKLLNIWLKANKIVNVVLGHLVQGA